MNTSCKARYLVVDISSNLLHHLYQETLLRLPINQIIYDYEDYDSSNEILKFSPLFRKSLLTLWFPKY